jgi:hypothetical protein
MAFFHGKEPKAALPPWGASIELTCNRSAHVFLQNGYESFFCDESGAEQQSS